MRLWELTAEMQDLQRACETVERPEELQPFLDCLNECREETIAKVDGIACLINELEHKSKAAASEEFRLRELSNRYSYKAQWLKDYVQRCLQGAGIEKVSGSRFTVSLAKCPPSVEVVDQDKIPSQFIRRETTVSVDKREIMDYWKNVGEVAGVRIVNDKKRLSIK